MYVTALTFVDIKDEMGDEMGDPEYERNTLSGLCGSHADPPKTQMLFLVCRAPYPITFTRGLKTKIQTRTTLLSKHMTTAYNECECDC